MTKIEIVDLLGDILADIDGLLSRPELPTNSQEWQKLYELRTHLDEEQRDLVKGFIDENTAQYAKITSDLTRANQELAATLSDIQRIAATIQTLSSIASFGDGLLSLAK